MKKFTKILTKVAICLLSAFSFSISEAGNPFSLPKPLVAAKEAGDYFEHLEGMRVALEKNDLREFYTLAKTFTKKKQGDRRIRKIEGRPLYAPSDAVAWDWWGYYVACAPLFGEEIVDTDRRFIELDVEMKSSACFNLARRNAEERGKLFKREVKQLKAGYDIQLQHLMKTLKEGHKNWIEVTKKRGELISQRIKEFKKMNSDKDFFENQYQYKIKYYKIVSPLDACYTRTDNFQFALENVEKGFVKKLMESYPKDGARVQEIIMKCGYKTKEECRNLLLRTVGRKKETEYLFRGLPKVEPPKSTKK